MEDNMELYEEFSQVIIEETLFKDVKFYVSGTIPDWIIQLLLNGGGKQEPHITDFMSHLITGTNPDDNHIWEARDIYEKPVVTHHWVTYSAKCGKQLPIEGFCKSSSQLFSGVKASVSKLGLEDSRTVWGLINFYGGRCNLDLDHTCTHLITGLPEGIKWDRAISRPIIIVTPDWVMDSIEFNERQDEVFYHPRLLRSSQSPMPHKPRKKVSRVRQVVAKPPPSLPVPESGDLGSPGDMFVTNEAKNDNLFDQASVKETETNLFESLTFSDDDEDEDNSERFSLLDQLKNTNSWKKTPSPPSALPTMPSLPLDSAQTTSHPTPNSSSGTSTPISIFTSVSLSTSVANIETSLPSLVSSAAPPISLPVQTSLISCLSNSLSTSSSILTSISSLSSVSLISSSGHSPSISQPISTSSNVSVPILISSPLSVTKPTQSVVQIIPASSLSNPVSLPDQASLSSTAPSSKVSISKIPEIVSVTSNQLITSSLSTDRPISSFISNSSLTNASGVSVQYSNTKPAVSSSQLLGPSFEPASKCDSQSVSAGLPISNTKTTLVSLASTSEVNISYISKQSIPSTQATTFLSSQSITGPPLTPVGTSILSTSSTLTAATVETLKSQGIGVVATVLPMKSSGVSVSPLVTTSKTPVIGSISSSTFPAESNIASLPALNYPSTPVGTPLTLPSTLSGSFSVDALSSNTNPISSSTQQGVNKPISLAAVESRPTMDQKQSMPDSDKSKMIMTTVNASTTLQTQSQGQIIEAPGMKSEKPSPNESFVQQSFLTKPNTSSLQHVQNPMSVTGVQGPPNITIRNTFPGAQFPVNPRARQQAYPSPTQPQIQNAPGSAVQPSSPVNVAQQQVHSVAIPGAVVRLPAGVTHQQLQMMSNEERHRFLEQLHKKQIQEQLQRGSARPSKPLASVSYKTVPSGATIHYSNVKGPVQSPMASQQASWDPTSQSRPRLDAPVYGSQSNQFGHESTSNQVSWQHSQSRLQQQRPISIQRQQMQPQQICGQTQSQPQQVCGQRQQHPLPQTQRLPLPSPQHQQQASSQQVAGVGHSQMLPQSGQPRMMNSQQQYAVAPGTRVVVGQSSWQHSSQQQVQNQGQTIQQNLHPQHMQQVQVHAQQLRQHFPHLTQQEAQQLIQTIPTHLREIQSRDNAGRCEYLAALEPRERQIVNHFYVRRHQQQMLQRQQLQAQHNLKIGTSQTSWQQQQQQQQSPGTQHHRTLVVGRPVSQALASQVMGSPGQTIQHVITGNTVRVQSPGSVGSSPNAAVGMSYPRGTTQAGSSLPGGYTRPHLYGHDINTMLPRELCMVGCVFYIADYHADLYPSVIHGWKRVIQQHGGEVVNLYETVRVTHVLCKHQQSTVFQQAVRENKRCITVYWLNDILIRGKMAPPWQAIHLPTPFDNKNKPMKGMLVSVTGFENEERDTIKLMLYLAGAEYTGHFSTHNQLLVCKKFEGLKVSKAKEWKKAVVNGMWLSEVLLGQNTPPLVYLSTRYQHFLDDPLRIDPSLASHLFNAWKLPISVSKESVEKAKAVREFALRKRKVDDAGLVEGKKQCIGTNKNVLRTPNATSHAASGISKRSLSDAKPIRVLLASMKNKEDFERKILELGGIVVRSPPDATHFVMDCPDIAIRTIKLMCAISCCDFIISSQWVIDSASRGFFLDEENYALTMSPDLEKLLNFRLIDVMSITNRNELFKGFTFFITPSVVPGRTWLKEIVLCSGGTVDAKRKPVQEIKQRNRDSMKYICISTDMDNCLVRDIIQEKLPVYYSEFILIAILRQKIDYSIAIFPGPKTEG